MDTNQILSGAGQEFTKIIEHLKTEYSRVQAGRASANLLEGIQVEAYGTNQPIKAVGNITVPDAKTLVVQPWDSAVLSAIEKAIVSSDLGLNPVNDGSVIRINIPALTEERRRDLTKLLHKMAEDARISVRNVRQKIQTQFKEMEKNGEITEDDLRGSEKKLQDKVDEVNRSIEEAAKHKESDIMTI